MCAYDPIGSEMHDLLKVACQREYLLDIKLHDGQRLILRAAHLRTSITKEEFIVFQRNSIPQEVRLDKLGSVATLEPDAEFDFLEFAKSA